MDVLPEGEALRTRRNPMVDLKDVYDMAECRGIDLDALGIAPEQLIMGIDHEQEHIRPDEKYPADKGFDIAMDHLREIPDYYTRLERMEAEWRAETGRRSRSNPGGNGGGTVSRLSGKLFPLGRLVMTAGVSDAIADDMALSIFMTKCLKRHASGDWGDLDPEDMKANDNALRRNDGRLFSSYRLPNAIAGPSGDDKLWIITEWDRSATTVLLPSEY